MERRADSAEEKRSKSIEGIEKQKERAMKGDSEALSASRPRANRSILF